MKTYRFVDGEYEIRTEIKRSVFIVNVKGEVDGDSAEEFVKSIRKKYPDATHNCYAYIADALGNRTRFSDDGEPSGTAGQPILDVLRKQNLVRSAVVVTRYFGGIKLGAGGLVGAYSGCTADAIAQAKISQKVECGGVIINTDYSTFANVEKFLRKCECHIENIEYGDCVECMCFVPLDSIDGFVSSVFELSCGKAKVAKTQDNQYKKIG